VAERPWCATVKLAEERGDVATNKSGGGCGVEGVAFGEDVIGDFAKFADEAEPGKDFEGVEGDVDFPPVESLTRTGHVVVMVVVPAFAEGDEGEQPVVFAGVCGGETAIAEDVRERIDGEGAVPEQGGAEEKAPSEQGPAANQPEGDSQDGGGDEVILVQPAKFGIFGEVADVVETSIVVPVGEDPANVRPPEAEERGRMEIVFLIGEAVVMAMMSGPPKDALLRGGHSHPGEDELEPAAGFEGTVREVAVVASGDEEHTEFVDEEAGNQIGPLERKEEDAESSEMNEKKRNCGNELQPCAVGQRDRNSKGPRN